MAYQYTILSSIKMRQAKWSDYAFRQLGQKLRFCLTLLVAMILIIHKGCVSLFMWHSFVESIKWNLVFELQLFWSIYYWNQYWDVLLQQSSGMQFTPVLSRVRYARYYYIHHQIISELASFHLLIITSPEPTSFHSCSYGKSKKEWA